MVWLESAAMPAGGAPIVNIDRRKISIETKRMLERMPGLQFRQGFVTDLRLRDDGVQPSGLGSIGQPGGNASEPGMAGRSSLRRVEVETIFGEVFEADAVVVAVGLSLGGSTAVGGDTVHGGRYGEPSSEGLLQALQRLGAELGEAHLEVGGRVSGRHAGERDWLGGHVGSEGASRGQTEAVGPREEVLEPALPDAPTVSWPSGYPPAPHRQTDLTCDRMIVEDRLADFGGKTSFPVLSPDGGATFEMYVAPDGAFAEKMAVTGQDAEAIASRMPLTVSGMTVAGLGDAGRMHVHGRPTTGWVVGRAAGAPDYVASLVSGMRAASEIVAVVCRNQAGDDGRRGDDGGQGERLGASDGTRHSKGARQSGRPQRGDDARQGDSR
jgi:hypothetical protein